MQMITIRDLSEEKEKQTQEKTANRQRQKSKGTYNNNKKHAFFFLLGLKPYLLTRYLPTYLPTFLPTYLPTYSFAFTATSCNWLQFLEERSSADKHQWMNGLHVCGSMFRKGRMTKHLVLRNCVQLF
jgi:hypothetical protein